MQLNGTDIPSLQSALNQNLPIILEPDGFWYVEGSLRTRIRSILNLEENRIRTNAKSATELLDSLEKTPVIMGSVEQRADFKGYLQVAQTIASQLKSYRTEESKQVRNELLRRIVGLRYRMEMHPAKALPTLMQLLDERALRWKKKQPLLAYKPLTQQDKECLQGAIAYPEFVELLLQDPALEKKFFKWVLRDHIDPAPFIEFPFTQEKLVKHHFSGRISRHGGRVLKIKKVFQSNRAEKMLTLPFEGIDISILDPAATVVFKGNLTLTIEEIFTLFKNKNLEVGDLEFMSEGITNWNIHKLGWKNAQTNEYEMVDITKKGWWRDLPALETLSKEVLQERYRCRLDPLQWVVALCASRTSANLDFNQCHAYLEVAIPIGNGRYNIYDFGKLATYYPEQGLDSLTFFCTTTHATVAFPDESIFYTHRQHVNKPFIISSLQGFRLMDALAADIQRYRDKNFVYQIESENCAKWTEEMIKSVLGEGNVPDLFKMHLLETEPSGFLGHLFGFIKMLPDYLHLPILTLLHRPLGASKGVCIIENGITVCKRLTEHEFWKTGIVYLPALLHQKREMELLGLTSVEVPKASQVYIPALKRAAPIILPLKHQILHLSSRLKPVEAATPILSIR